MGDIGEILRCLAVFSRLKQNQLPPELCLACGSASGCRRGGCGGGRHVVTETVPLWSPSSGPSMIEVSLQLKV